MRVTNASHAQMLMQHLQLTTLRQSTAAERIASGRQLSRLSDDPGQAVRIHGLRSEEQRLHTYTDAADDARAWLATQDGALQSAANLLHRARELTIAAGNDVLSDDAVAGIALEIEGLRDQLVVIANTQFQGRAVFAGFGERAVEAAGSTVTFVGDDGEVNRRIGQGQIVRVNVSGAEVFGFADGDDVFTVLTDIADLVRARDVDAITTSALDRVTARFQDVTANLGRVGARMNTVDQAETIALSQMDATSQRRSSLEDVDFGRAVLELTASQTAYEAVIALVGRLQLPSLASFLR